jgi:hypothetical protein
MVGGIAHAGYSREDRESDHPIKMESPMGTFSSKRDRGQRRKGVDIQQPCC